MQEQHNKAVKKQQKRMGKQKRREDRAEEAGMKDEAYDFSTDF